MSAQTIKWSLLFLRMPQVKSMDFTYLLIFNLLRILLIFRENFNIIIIGETERIDILQSCKCYPIMKSEFSIVLLLIAACFPIPNEFSLGSTSHIPALQVSTPIHSTHMSRLNNPIDVMTIFNLI